MTLAILLYRQARERSDRFRAVPTTVSTSTRFTASSSAPRREFSRSISAFIDRWILDVGFVRGAQRRDLGLRLAPPAAPSRQPAGLFLSLRFGNRGPDLLHTFPVILLFIVFCPIVAALAILLGAPARRTALWAAGFTARGDRCSLISRLRTGPARFSIRHLLSDQQRLADQFHPRRRWPEPDDAAAHGDRDARGHLVHRRNRASTNMLSTPASSSLPAAPWAHSLRSISFSSTPFTSSP